MYFVHGCFGEGADCEADIGPTATPTLSTAACGVDETDMSDSVYAVTMSDSAMRAKMTTCGSSGIRAAAHSVGSGVHGERSAPIVARVKFNARLMGSIVLWRITSFKDTCTGMDPAYVAAAREQSVHNSGLSLLKRWSSWRKPLSSQCAHL
jgi:hypothetical protein